MKCFIYSTVCFFMLITMLSSCQLGKHYTRPSINLPENLDSLAVDSSSIADFHWWEIYTDTTLQALIYQTLEYNKDMLSATAHIREMAALKRIDLANLFPQINGQIYTDKEAENYGGNSYKSTPEYSAKLLVSWEIDLWGNLRWAKDKSTAEFVESIENQRALKMSLVAQVAQSYFELVAMDNELNITQQTLKAREEALHLAKIRFEGGLTSEIQYQQAQVEYARTATLIPGLERDIALKENEISVLAGHFPSRIERARLPENIKLPETLPAGLLSTLLERRPDIRASEQKLIAANAEVGIAYTNFFPKLALTAHYGLESDEFKDFLHSPYHFLSGNLLAPLFDMGKNRAVLKARKAAYESAVYQYEKTVLSAFKEARNAIIEFSKIKDIYDSRLKLEQAARSNANLAEKQYIQGSINYLDLLDAQRTYFEAQVSLSNAIRDKQIALVQLYKALGGGWE